MKRIGFSVVAMILAAFILAACSSKQSEQEMYDKAKELYSSKELTEAIEQFKELGETYPDGQYHAQSLFMIGFISANDLQDTTQAREYYNRFIKAYPEHELADDAGYELQNLGKDINELPIFEQLSADSAAAESGKQ